MVRYSSIHEIIRYSSPYEIVRGVSLSLLNGSVLPAIIVRYPSHYETARYPPTYEIVRYSPHMKLLGTLHI